MELRYELVLAIPAEQLLQSLEHLRANPVRPGLAVRLLHLPNRVLPVRRGLRGECHALLREFHCEHVLLRRLRPKPAERAIPNHLHAMQHRDAVYLVRRHLHNPMPAERVLLPADLRRVLPQRLLRERLRLRRVQPAVQNLLRHHQLHVVLLVSMAEQQHLRFAVPERDLRKVFSFILGEQRELHVPALRLPLHFVLDRAERCVL